MITLRKKYNNGLERTLRVLSCVISPDGESAIVQTQDDGEMVISKPDWPDVWDNFEKKAMFQDAKAIADAKRQQLEALDA